MFVQSIESDGAAIASRIAGHFETAFRQMMPGPRTVAKPAYLRIVTGEAHPMGNVAIVSEPDDPDSTLEAIAPLIDCGAPAAAIFPHGVSDRVAEAVAAHGFGIEESMPAMAVDIDRMSPTSLPPGYGWARIGRGDASRSWTDALAVGYELPRALAEIFSLEVLGVDMAPDATTQFFSVLRDERHVATSMLYLADGVAGIYCVSTLPEERNRGLGAHATAEALRVARRLGYRVGVLQSSGAGYPVYLRLGFGDFGRIPMRIRMPG